MSTAETRSQPSGVATPAEGTILVEAKQLRKAYPAAVGQDLEVLRGVDMRIHTGEFISIMGLSGVGKSTLLNILGLLDRPTGGSLVFHRSNGSATDTAQLGVHDRALLRNEFLGFVFQHYHLLPDLSVLENVLMPTMISRSAARFRRDRAELTANAEHYLERVGVADRRHHRPSQLSGGERQRCAIARALINSPRLLLCDEPTGNLDSQTSASMHDLFAELNSTLGTTTLVVTHDPNLAARADRSLEMVDGSFATRSPE